MAKVRKNPVVRGVSGRVGNLVFRQMPDGSTSVSGTPDFSRRKFSAAQAAHQARVKEAAEYGKDAARSHPIYAQLAKESKGLSAYNFAFADYMKPPVIKGFERVDGVVRVRASDNVLVTKVEVRIVDALGAALVTGLASLVGEDVWEFASEVEGRVLARVWDLAGNVTEGGL